MTPETILTVGTAVLVQTAILSGLVLLADRFMPRRMVRERHDLALATILAVPLLFIVPFLVSGEPAPLPVMEEAAGAITETVPLLAVEPAVVTVQSTPAAAAPDFTGLLTALAFMGWGLGVAYFLIRLGMDMLRVRTMIARARPVSVPGVRVAGNVRLMVSDEADGPMLAGVLRPAILLPEDMVDDPALAPVIQHELAHVVRRDNLVEIGVRMISALFWWVLPLHVLPPVIRREREKLCDAYAARHAGGGDIMATVLLDVAKRRLSRSPALAMPAVRQRDALAARLRLLTGDGIERPRMILTATLVPAVFLACAAAGPKLGQSSAVEMSSDDELKSIDYDYDYDVNVNYDDDDEGLYFAARRGDTREVERLLAAGADPDQVFPGDGTPLIGAVRSGDHGILTRLLYVGADPDVFSLGDGSPLISAVRAGNAAMVKTLLEAGATPDMGVPGDGNPLIAAAHRGDVRMISMLLDAGADIEAKVSGDGNALIAAAQSGKAEAVLLLLDNGADPNAFVLRDETPLVAAAQQGHLDVAKLLVARGADVSLTVPAPQSDASRNGYRSPVSEAERKGHTRMLEWLLGQGAEHRPPQ